MSSERTQWLSRDTQRPVHKSSLSTEVSFPSGWESVSHKDHNIPSASTGTHSASRDDKVAYEPVLAMEKGFTAIFKSRKDASIPPIQVPAILDISSERNTISEKWDFGRKMWTAGQEIEIEKPRSFQGRRGRLCEAKNKIPLTWHPVGSEKTITTDFFILMDSESEVVLGREFVDFQGIFHDLDLDVSPFRLPGMKKSRGKYCQRGMIYIAD
jgi:hypothetical protein